MRSIVVWALLGVLCACGSKPGAPIAGARPPEAKPTATGPASPYDYTTWTAKLDDPREMERAVTELEQLGNPAAIPALGAAWREQGRPVRILQVMISLSRPVTPEQAKAMYLTDYETTGRKASWNVSMPFLVEALAKIDIANPRSVDSATKAADAIGEAMDPAGLEALVGIASMPPQKKMIAAQVSAIRAMGTFKGVARAATALVQIIERVPPAHPRTATNETEGREMEERFGLHLAMTGAAINAVGELHSAAAANALVLAMYRTPELFMQIRRALVATGPVVKDELRKILRGEHTRVNDLFAKERLDTYCSDKSAPKTCARVSAKDFYAAVVLGDFYDPAATADLLAALERPALPVYYMDDQSSPNTQHDAIFDSLRKSGSADAAAPMRAIWTSKKRDLATRIAAIGVYPFVARDTTGVEELGKIAADNTADDMLRQGAATAFARLATDAKSIAILQGLADRYFKAAADKKKELDGKPKRDAEAAEAALVVQKKIIEKAKADLLAIVNDHSKTTDEIMIATEGVRKLERDREAFTKKHKDVIAPYRMRENAMKVYRAYARMFQIHIARIEIAMRCQQDLACYASSLTLTPAAAATNLTPYIQDIGEWTNIEKQYLVDANIERAMLELGKRGARASHLTDSLLAAVKSETREVRQSILLALPKIAKIPCAACEIQLDAAIKAGEGKTELGDLNVETTMLRNYFAWAGHTP